MTESLLEQARKWRDLVLLAELGGWLHDLGKLSSGFVRSKTGQREEWVHGEVFTYDEEVIPDELKRALESFLTGSGGWLPRLEGKFGTDHVSLKDMVSGHHQDRSEHIQGLLKLADHGDSGEDVYNAAEIYQQEPVQAATVFGLEKPLARGTLEALDEARLKKLYPQLNEVLSPLGAPAVKRSELWKLLQEAMRHGLGKTQRAANDIRLDQHAWSVATRFKAFLMRDLLDPPREGQIRRTFRLLTVWWNWWELITPFARLSDVVGRQVMLKQLRKDLRQAIEDEYAIGNQVYEDDNGVHFLVADLPWDTELTGLARGIANQLAGGEVQPVVRLSPPTEWVTHLVQQMDKASEELPVVGEPAWVGEWPSPSGEICPVCQRRPLEGERDLCQWCEERRHDGIKQRLEDRAGTVWTGEIADKNGRVALIVARFDLKRWLDGTMLHTLFITSPQDLAHSYPDMQDTADWHHLHAGVQRFLEEKERPLEPLGKYRADVKGAQRELDQSEDSSIPPERRLRMRTQAERQLAEAVTGFWAALIAHERNRYGGEKGRHICETMASLPASYSQENAFLLALVRKNPSASRLLRVWQTTEEFLDGQAKGLEEWVEERQRVVFTLEKPPHSGIYTAELPGLGRMDIFVRPAKDDKGRRKAETIEWLKPGDTERLRAVKELHLVADERGQIIDWDCGGVEVEQESYLPYQVITVSPNLMLAMVPADRAMSVAETMQEAYVQQFGKVQGRLPFHVGLIFMDAHYPMFAVLDTARRLAETFDRLAEKPVEARLEALEEKEGISQPTLTSNRFGTWTWHVSVRRGDGETDWYHPYFLVREEQGLEERGMSLIGPEGWWVHVSDELKKGDRIAFWPNLFDFLFLDTVSRRLDARADSDTKRRPHPLLGRHSPRPYLLERVSHLREVWETICGVSGMSETRLAAAASFLARKWENWGLANSDEHKQAWEWLVAETVSRDFGGEESIKNAILDGTFFDAVELYRHILKKKVESRPSEEIEEAKK